jgi:hypothetical protein
MREGMCQFKYSPKEIKHSTEDKVKKKIPWYFCVYIFFSIPIMHSLTFSFAIVDLLMKLSFLKQLCTSKNQLCYVTSCKIIWEWMQKYRLH